MNIQTTYYELNSSKKITSVISNLNSVSLLNAHIRTLKFTKTASDECL